MYKVEVTFLKLDLEQISIFPVNVLHMQVFRLLFQPELKVFFKVNEASGLSHCVQICTFTPKATVFDV